MMKGHVLGIVLTAFVLTGTAYAADAPAAAPAAAAPEAAAPATKPAPHKGISNAQVEACTSKPEGSECSYTNHKGKKMSGSCTKNKKGDVIYCKAAKKAKKSEK